MSESGLTTIDKALAEIDRLRETLLALRLMPESMPANPVDLAMSAALRRLNFEEKDGALGTRYFTDNVAGFDRVEIAWNEQYAFIRNVIVVRSLGQTRRKGPYESTVEFHAESESGKLIEVPKPRLADSPVTFMATLFMLIADPANYEPIREACYVSATNDYKPTLWPKTGWVPSDVDRTRLEIQVAKGKPADPGKISPFANPGKAPTPEQLAASLIGSTLADFRNAEQADRIAKGKPPVASALMNDSAADMTEAERKACELLDKKAFF